MSWLRSAASRRTPAQACLPVLRDEPPFDPGRAFSVDLADLVGRRIARFADVLRSEVPDVEAVGSRTVELLRALPQRPTTLLHGDLIPANVLLDDRGSVSAVLDFGFLTTLGDPAFDAAVTASVFDMYGEHARTSELRLDAAFADRFDHPPQVLGLYRAAYALTTSNLFSTSGSDWHFAWCIRLLQRADVREALAT
jgi:aminoglycoside phosphotransferase (APT) family kinase protein